MKQNFKRILCLTLACLTLGLTACKDDGEVSSSTMDSSGGSNSSPVVPTMDFDKHTVAGTLHKISVTDSERVFTQNGQTAYKIVADIEDVLCGTATKKAADFIQMHTTLSTGALLPVVTNGVNDWLSTDLSAPCSPREFSTT